MESKFNVYMDSFKPYLFHTLGMHEDTQVCITAIGVVSDLYRVFEEELLLTISDEIMEKLIFILQVIILNLLKFLFSLRT